MKIDPVIGGRNAAIANAAEAAGFNTRDGYALSKLLKAVKHANSGYEEARLRPREPLPEDLRPSRAQPGKQFLLPYSLPSSAPSKLLLQLRSVLEATITGPNVTLLPSMATTHWSMTILLPLRSASERSKTQSNLISQIFLRPPKPIGRSLHRAIPIPMSHLSLFALDL